MAAISLRDNDRVHPLCLTAGTLSTETFIAMKFCYSKEKGNTLQVLSKRLLGNNINPGLGERAQSKQHYCPTTLQQHF